MLCFTFFFFSLFLHLRLGLLCLTVLNQNGTPPGALSNGPPPPKSVFFSASFPPPIFLTFCLFLTCFFKVFFLLFSCFFGRLFLVSSPVFSMRFFGNMGRSGVPDCTLAYTKRLFS